MSPTERHNPNLRDLPPGRGDAAGEPPADEEDEQFDEVDIDETEVEDDDIEETEIDVESDDDLIDDSDEDVDVDIEEYDEAVVEVVPKRARRERVRAERPAREPKAPREEHHGAFARMYRGETKFDFVGRKKWWFLLSAIIIVAGLVSLSVRGLNLGIDFKGGDSWTVLAPGVTQTQATTAMQNAGLTEPVVEILGGRTIQVQADLNSLTGTQQTAESDKVIAELAKLGHVPTNAVSSSTVGPSWGGQVTQRAIIALIVFFILVAIYISFRFEPKMALAAFIAMVHDLAVAIGVYSLAGFQVTPDTVIAILTILGYSLYDTVVVFDRVRDNTMGLGSSGRMTYSEMVNLSMNQTLARSLNTSLVAILPVFAVLVVGAEILGATTLQNYGLALLVGLISGAYSSIFIASPLLAIFKERETRYATLRQRLESRGGERAGVLTPAAAALLAGASGGSRAAGRDRDQRAPVRSGALRPGTAQRARTRRPPAAASRAPRPANGGDAPPSPTATGSSTAGTRPGPARTNGRPAPRPRKGGAKGKKRRR